MNLFLKRTSFEIYGVFGELTDEKGNLVAVTIERAYFDGGTYAPKIPIGMFRCIRGDHKLHGMVQPFTTFEITGVIDSMGNVHSGLLFHWGNKNIDSEGCVLLGQQRESNIIINSRDTFAKFMVLQQWVKEFVLTVS